MSMYKNAFENSKERKVNRKKYFFKWSKKHKNEYLNFWKKKLSSDLLHHKLEVQSFHFCRITKFNVKNYFFVSKIDQVKEEIQ